MKIEIVKKLISILREKKEKYYKGINNDEVKVNTADYHEYYTLFLSLLQEIASQQPSYNISLMQIPNTFSNAAKINIYNKILDSIEKEIEIGLIKDTDDIKNQNNSDILSNIFDNFHSCCKQARQRYDNRTTIDVDDEYDVQDLLHIILQLFFTDIRSEEWTPSYAGSSARMDFLLKNEQIVIEVKKTRKTLKDKEVGNQLLVDIERYKIHQDCKTLYCFVYDPDGYISNPEGLEKDLSGVKNNLNVKVFIRPK